MTILLAQNFIVGFPVKVFFGAGGLALVQSDDLVFLPHLVTVDSTESGGETTVSGDEEDGAIFDAVIGLSGECRAKLSVDDAGAAVGYNSAFERIRRY